MLLEYTIYYRFRTYMVFFKYSTLSKTFTTCIEHNFKRRCRESRHGPVQPNPAKFKPEELLEFSESIVFSDDKFLISSMRYYRSGERFHYLHVSEWPFKTLIHLVKNLITGRECAEVLEKLGANTMPCYVFP